MPYQFIVSSRNTKISERTFFVLLPGLGAVVDFCSTNKSHQFHFLIEEFLTVSTAPPPPRRWRSLYVNYDGRISSGWSRNIIVSLSRRSICRFLSIRNPYASPGFPFHTHTYSEIKGFENWCFDVFFRSVVQLCPTNAILLCARETKLYVRNFIITKISFRLVWYVSFIIEDF